MDSLPFWSRKVKALDVPSAFCVAAQAGVGGDQLSRTDSWSPEPSPKEGPPSHLAFFSREPRCDLQQGCLVSPPRCPAQSRCAYARSLTFCTQSVLHDTWHALKYQSRIAHRTCPGRHLGRDAARTKISVHPVLVDSWY